MTGDARVLATEADLVAAIAAAEQVDAQELVAELIGQLVALQAARQQQRRVRRQDELAVTARRARNLADVWVKPESERPM